MEDLRLWELVTGKEVLRYSPQEYARGNRSISFATSLAFSPDGRSVATGMADTNILVWDLAPATRRKVALSAKHLDQLWADLGEEDAAQAYRAAGALIAAPDQAIAFLQKHLRPTEKDAGRIAQLIADLDSDRFTVRDAAHKQLEQIGEPAESALRKVLEGRPSAEVRRSVEGLLGTSWVIRSSERLRQVRAVYVHWSRSGRPGHDRSCRHSPEGRRKTG